MLHSHYTKLLEETRAWYKTVKKVFCPVLAADVVFNAKGFYHLMYDGTGTARTIEERIRRLNLIRHVVPIIQNATSILRKRQGSSVTYWVLKEGAIMVVITKKGNGNYFYNSVMDE